MKEQWRDIPGYEGWYQVSSIGQVRSLDRVVLTTSGVRRSMKGRVREQRTNADGYLQVGLHKDGKNKNKSVHRLVAIAFIPNPENLPCVNHINEIPCGNEVHNLEWCTQQYNIEYSISKRFEFISPDGELIAFVNLTKFCRENNLNQGGMGQVHRGRRHHHKGWTRAM